MKKTKLAFDIQSLPSELRALAQGARVYDCSSSPEARVYFIDRDGGYYIKRSGKGALTREAEMTRYFHKRGLGAELVAYIQDAYDWMLTKAVRGDDCTHGRYLDDPKRLCDTLALYLRELHDTDASDCPMQDRMAQYVRTAEQNKLLGVTDTSFFLGENKNEEYIWKVALEGAPSLDSSVLLHGDYCLPNIILNDWRLSGFIDVGCGGIGDRHIDLFWGTWTLAFNLGTDKYRERFLDAYGTDVTDKEKIRIVSAFEVFG